MRQLLLLFIVSFAFAQSVAAEPSVEPSWTFIEKRMNQENFSPAFIQEMKKLYEPQRFGEVVRLNVLLFMKKSDYHGVQVSSQATEEVKAFTDANKAALDAASTQYGVPSNVISSLIWIESRHGKNVGNFHVPSVYLHLLQSNRKPVLKYLATQTYRFTEKTTAKQRREIPIRANRKVVFAIAELKALQKVFKWKWKLGSEFRGSFAGAFGMPQFIPSSYVQYARSYAPPAQPNLMMAEDAIMSVGHYLKVHGWKKNKSSSHLKALMKYNNSRDYANAILNLAETLEERSTASAKN